jgi:hypothetical protein
MSLHLIRRLTKKVFCVGLQTTHWLITEEKSNKNAAADVNLYGSHPTFLNLTFMGPCIVIIF